jgi:hypothetical protein
VVGVPDRLEQRVGEAQRQQVLDRLLAQVVVDAEDVVGGEHGVDELVELLRARQVVPERLLDDDAAPAPGLAVVGHAGAAHLLEHRRERRRRDRQVERGVALRPGVALGLAQHLGQLVEGVVVVEGAGRKRIVSASRCHTSSRNSVRAPLRAASRASSSNSPSPQSRRAKPSSTKPGGSSPRLARSYTAGMSFFFARSPVTPKTTSAHGSGTRGQPPVAGVAQRVRAGGRRGHGRPALRQQRAQAGRAVDQVQAQHRAGRAGRAREVAQRLRRLQRAEGEVAARDLEVLAPAPSPAGSAGLRAALVELPGGVQEARRPPERHRVRQPGGQRRAQLRGVGLGPAGRGRP